MTIRSKSDVEFHRDNFGPERPAVNVKIYADWRRVPLPLDFGRVSDDQGKTWTEVRSDPGFTVDWIEAHVSEGAFETFYQLACENGWEYLQTIAEEIYGSGVTVYSEGRSGGWAVVDGIEDDVDSWDAIELGKWRRFAKAAREIADDVPRAALDGLYANVYEPERDEQTENAGVHRDVVPS
jgi:hypothetical protein